MQNNEGLLPCSTEENKQLLRHIFSNCCDLVFRNFEIDGGKTSCFIAYINGAVRIENISESILKPLMSTHMVKSDASWLAKHIKLTVSTVCAAEEIKTAGDVTDRLLGGYCLLFADGCPTCLALDVEGWAMRQTGEANVEPTLRGSVESFVEDITINTSLIRRRIKTPKLKVERMGIGTISKTAVMIAYIEGIADDIVVDKIRSRLKSIDADMVLESGTIENFIRDNPYCPFPTIEFTERPDLSALALSEGRVVVLTDNAPFVLIAPAVFSHFFMAAEDAFVSPYFTVFITIVRGLAFFISLLAPSIFIAITLFHQEMIPYQLLETLVASRSDLPFPIFFEVLLMELAFDLISEAGERLPRAIGSSLSIVGAIVLGQAAIQSGLVSPSTVVVVAATATASFVNPKLNMSRASRILRFPFMILGASMGLFGIVMGGLTLLIYMVSIRSFGVPYMSPFSPSGKGDWQAMLLRLPLRFAPQRPTAIQKNNVTRVKNRSGA